MKWILVYTIIVGSSVATSNFELESQKQCQYAGDFIKAIHRHLHVLFACVEKK